jgi:outer membrane receptor protein involved in Fe transport
MHQVSFVTKLRIPTLVLIVALIALSTPVFGQTLITGEIAGTISDPTNAVVPAAVVNLKSLDTGATESTITNGAGVYRFSLLKPGHYQVTVTQPGFQKAQRETTVVVGQTSTTDLQLQVGAATQTVEVEAAAPLINPQPSNSTAFTPAEVQELPSPGGDITNIAETAPGVVMNTSGAMEGYGNFTVNGLPATSNLFTVNGENDMDPYFNINNSGATNLTLGQNEVQEATVITNAYAGEYGQLSGAQVTYVTKAGTNEFHGNALWYWNGRYMNANDWFNNEYGVPRPFDNDNQWAASIGGPIIKNKTFFFVDNEGLRFVLPNLFTNTIPTPAFQSAVLASVGAAQPSEVPLYQKMFNLYNNAPNAASATPIPNSSECSGLSIPGFNGAAQDCAEQFRNSATSLGTEWILAFRVDQKIGNNDNAFFRYKLDHGLQPTSISSISPNFDALSNQPSYDMQLNETHTLGATSTNNFMATFSHYVAQFTQNYQQASSTFPDTIAYSGDMGEFTGFNPIDNFPQGRNVTQYQFIDDFTHLHGNHNLKFGVNFRRYDVSDHNFFFNSPRVVFGGSGVGGLQDFANGTALEFIQNDNPIQDVPIALWGMGAYAQDEWKVRPNLTLTFALRLERTSNPVCQYNCFANFVGPYNGLPSVTSANPMNVPYSSDIASGLHSAYMGIDEVNPAPRFGFSWSPRQGNRSTVVSGGFGIFYDNVPESLVDNLLHNPPQSVGIVELGVPPFASGPGGAPAIYSASVAAFSINKSFSQISAAFPPGAVFFPPSVNGIEGTLHSPRTEEWNLQVQQQMSNSVVLIVGYAGNHSIRIPYVNNWPNAFDAGDLFPHVPGIQETASANPDYGQVSLVQSGALANYNGLTVTVRKQFSHWVSGIANYTWSHGLDDVSNGGINPYNFFFGAAQSQINPLSLRASNYGNSDYDIRHNFNAGWVVNPDWHFSSKLMKGVFGGWQFSGKWFWRSGLPFSVVDDYVNGDIQNGGPPFIYATPIAGNMQTACGHGSTQNALGTGNSCLNSSAFLNSGAAGTTFSQWAPQGRNSFRGPDYFDIDVALYKTFPWGEHRQIGVGVQAFNVLNHPDFGIPDNGLGDPTFGLISSMAGTPTSPYGSFLGFDSSPRIVQLSAKLTF